MIPPWTLLACSCCGTEGLATRAHPSEVEASAWLCNDCSIMIPLQDENARLRAEVERLRSAMARAEEELLRKASGSARAHAAHGVIFDALAREDGEG